VVIKSPKNTEGWIEAQNPKIDVVIAISTQERYEEMKDVLGRNIVLLVENKSIIRPAKAVAV